MHLVDGAPAQFIQHGRQIDFAIGVGQHRHLHATRAKLGHPRLVLTRRKHQHLAALEQARIQRRLEMTVDQHLERLARGFDITHIHARIVVGEGAHAGHDHAGASAPGVTVAPRRLRRNPLTLSIGQRGAAVQRRRHFQPHPRPAARHARDKADVEFDRLCFQQPGLDGNPRRAQFLKALPRHLGIGIAHGRHHALDARGHHRISAGRRAAVMAARFQRDIQGRAPGALARRSQRMHFGMRLAGALVETFAHHSAALHHHAADTRIGRGRVQAAPCQGQGALHVFIVGSSEHEISLGRHRVGGGRRPR